MEKIGSIIFIIISSISTYIGYLLIFIKHKNIDNKITLSLSISASILLLISIFELLPNSIIILISNYSYFLGIIITILVFVLGFTLITVFDLKIASKYQNKLCRVGILSSITLITHNILEGIIIFVSNNLTLTISMIIHNIVEGYLIAYPLYVSKSNKTLLFITISALSEPLGALLSYVLLKDILNELILAMILVFISGSMINLSINIIKNTLTNKKKSYIVYGFIIGIIIFIII